MQIVLKHLEGNYSREMGLDLGFRGEGLGMTTCR